MGNLTETSEVALCGNKDLSLEQRTGLEKGIASEESSEYVCYLCPGRKPDCSAYRPSNK